MWRKIDELAFPNGAAVFDRERLAAKGLAPPPFIHITNAAPDVLERDADGTLALLPRYVKAARVRKSPRERGALAKVWLAASLEHAFQFGASERAFLAPGKTACLSASDDGSGFRDETDRDYS